ncbi:helix-turn-helix domain-containing protein [Sinorhizobium numidicum]|uniref:Helix-turn-helix domain-containing protein n=1 Tax=Sinorhizobium numidicum TaxID=680248 RepID=A0ABY8CSS8_9HYPH|nr:helix-turn-helix transcriptional regulator [Sinorhizobium numidicum]WEX75222.1 helix-turn-helix domain-containing protein [Sinorhizobium numidicum]WEX81217.1 helix-turn-helix domain-containing protein [Sinorhizobium numidicum]
MARWKKPTKEETRALRRDLTAKAAAGQLQLPTAVAEVRKTFGLTQEQFAGITGLTRRQIAELETGIANPTLETLQKIGRLFGFSVGFVPKKSEEPAPELSALR